MSLGAVHRSALAYVGFGKQSVQGTAVSPAKFSRWHTMGPAEDMLKVGTYRPGFSKDLAVALKEGQYHDVTYTGWMYPDSTTALMAYFLGGSDTVTNNSTYYTHVFSECNELTDIPYVTVEHSMGTDQEVDRITDSRVDALKISAKAGGLVEVQTQFKGTVNNAQSSLSSVTWETARPATFVDATLTFSTLSVSTSDVTAVTLDWKNTTEQVYTLGSVYPYWMLPTAREFQVQFTVFVPNNDLYREIFFGSSSNTTGSAPLEYESSLTVEFNTTDSGPDQLIQVAIANIEMEAGKPNYSNDAKHFEVACTGKAIRTSLSEAMITVTADNQTATAYI